MKKKYSKKYGDNEPMQETRDRWSAEEHSPGKRLSGRLNHYGEDDPYDYSLSHRGHINNLTQRASFHKWRHEMMDGEDGA